MGGVGFTVSSSSQLFLLKHMHTHTPVSLSRAQKLSQSPGWSLQQQGAHDHAIYSYTRAIHASMRAGPHLNRLAMIAATSSTCGSGMVGVRGEMLKAQTAAESVLHREAFGGEGRG